MTEKTEPTTYVPSTYHDTRIVRLGGSDGATEFHGYSIEEIMKFMTFMQTLGSPDAMTATFPVGDRP